MKPHPTLLKSFGHATRGILAALRTERNIRVQLAAAAAAVTLGFLLRLTVMEWAAVLLCCAMVLGAELMNTAVETVVDLVSPGRNELAGRAKDLAAGAVWLTALAAAAVGVLVFGRAAGRMFG